MGEEGTGEKQLAGGRISTGERKNTIQPRVRQDRESSV